MKKLCAVFLAIICAVLTTIPTYATEVEKDRFVKEFESNVQYTAMLNSFKNEEGEIVYPNYYGGAYLNEAGLLVVNVTDNNAAILEEIRRITRNTDVIIEVVDYSYNYLLGLQNQVIEYIATSKNVDLIEKITSTAVLDNSNELTIGLTDTNDSTILNVINEIFYAEKRRTTVDALSIPLSFVYEVPVDMSANSVVQVSELQRNQSFDLYAGDMICIINEDDPENGSYCSVGFACYYNGMAGFVTCAHGCKIGERVVDSLGRTVGYVRHRAYGGNVDAAFVEITNPNVQLPMSIHAIFSDGTGEAIWPAPPASTAYVAVGSTIYKDGYVTNCTSSEVTSVNATYSYDDKIEGCRITMTDLIRTGAMVQKGDSGGIAFHKGTGTTAYKVGIVQGITHVAGITLVSYFVKSDNIRDDLGISFVAP